MLRAGIGHLAARAVLAPDRGNVDDHAGLFVQHMRQNGLNGVARAVEIDGEVALPQRVGHILKERLTGDARIIDQHGDRTEGILDRLDHRVDLITLRNVCLHGERAAALTGKLRGKLLGLIPPLVIVDADGIALAGKLCGDGAADAARGAGDKRGSVCWIHARSPTCGAKSALAARGLGQIGDLVELDGQIGQQDELRDALARADGARLLRIVVEGDKALAAVVAVNDAHAVGQAHTLLDAQPAAGEHQRHIVRRGQGDGDAGRDEPPLTGGQRHRLVDAGVQVGIVIGGGNFWRGRTSETIDRTKADQIGMLATVMNCIYVSEIFRSVGMMTSVLTPFECGSITKLYSKDRANKYFAHNMVVFFAGGTGHPYFSTDTATVLRAVEIEADGIYLAKAIDGVYDSDPKVNPSAKKYDQVSIQEVIDKKLAVVDLTASVMCMENHIPMYVFGLGETNSIVNAVNGQFNGTVVTVD